MLSPHKNKRLREDRQGSASRGAKGRGFFSRRRNAAIYNNSAAYNNVVRDPARVEAAHGEPAWAESNQANYGDSSATASAQEGNYDAASHAEPIVLAVIDGPFAGATTQLNRQTITLGRSVHNTIVLEDEFVSSYHAKVFYDAASVRYVVEDVGSTNGTLVNGQRIDGPVFLPPRVPVRIGVTTFELR